MLNVLNITRYGLFPRKLTALNGDKFIARSDTRAWANANENLSSQDIETRVSLRQWKHPRGGEEHWQRIAYTATLFRLEYLQIQRTDTRLSMIALKTHEIEIALHLYGVHSAISLCGDRLYVWCYKGRMCRIMRYPISPTRRLHIGISPEVYRSGRRRCDSASGVSR